MGRVPRGEHTAAPCLYHSSSPPPCLHGGSGDNAIVLEARPVGLLAFLLLRLRAGLRSLVTVQEMCIVLLLGGWCERADGRGVC